MDQDILGTTEATVLERSAHASRREGFLRCPIKTRLTPAGRVDRMASGPGSVDGGAPMSVKPCGGVLAVAAAAALLLGCQATVTSPRHLFLEDTLRYARIYRRHSDHEALRWLADNVVVKGIDRNTVESLIGEGGDPFVGDNEYTRMYWSRREPARGHYLLIHYDGRYVEDCEWVSE